MFSLFPDFHLSLLFSIYLSFYLSVFFMRSEIEKEVEYLLCPLSLKEADD